MKRENVKKTVLAAMLLAVGFVLPLLTGQIKEIGDTLLPMHLPVLLCGLLCGWKYGATVGFILPFLRSVVFSMPPIYPNAVWMALELSTYGLMIGLLYARVTKFSLGRLYGCLIVAMLCGRAVWGIAKALLLGLKGSVFTFSMFLTGAFIDSFAGIVLQLVLIPLLMSIVVKITKEGKNA